MAPPSTASTTLKFLSLKKNLDLELNTRLEIGAPFTITWRRAEPWTHSIIIHQKICRKKEKWGKTCLLALEHTLLLGSLCSMYSQQTIIIWHEKNEATEHREASTRQHYYRGHGGLLRSLRRNSQMWFRTKYAHFTFCLDDLLAFPF